jgi:hypothetical protein
VFSNGNTLYIISTETGPGSKLARMPRVFVSAKSVCTPWRSRMDSATRLPSWLSPPRALNRLTTYGA